MFIFMHLTYAVIIIISLGVAFWLMRASHKQKIPVAMTLVGVTCAIVIYFFIGNPDYADQPYKNVQQKEQDLKKLSIDELIALYEKGLKQKDSSQARLVLGNLLRRIGRLEQARTHFEAAYNMDNNLNIAINYADIMIALNQGIVPQESIDIIEKILITDKNHPQALLYKGLYAVQNNHKSQAIDIWEKLLADNTQESFYPILQRNVQTLIQRYDIPADSVGIVVDDTQITEKNLPMIEAMVESLRNKVAKDPTNRKLQERLKQVTKTLHEIKLNVKNNQ